MSKIDELKECITRVLMRNNKDTKQINIERYLQRRMNVVLKDILPIALSSVRHSGYPDDDTVKLFISTSYRKSWSQMTLNGKQVDAPGLLAPILFNVLYEGHSSIGSAVRIRERTLDALMEYAIEEADDALWRQTFDFDGLDVIETPVDLQSLRKYVKKLETAGDLLIQKKLRNLVRARSILASLTARPAPMMYGRQQPDVQVLVQEAIVADSGRCYLKGLNLQNCPKDIRHAALGHCHLYDMRAGVFGVLAGIAKAHIKSVLLQDKNFHHITNYISYRNEIRQQITKQLWPTDTQNFKKLWDYKQFHGFHKVKIALTAIGFGAKRHASASWKNQNGTWEATSLRKTFKSQMLVERFVNLPVVKELMDEFKEVTDIILLKLKTDSAFASAFAIEGLKDSQKLSMVYQGTESMIMGDFLRIVTADKVLLPVHDGMYVTERIDLASLHYSLKVPFNIDKAYVQFEHSQIGLATPENHEADHRLAIAAETLQAENYTPLPEIVDGAALSPATATKQQVMTSWGLMDADMFAEEEKMWRECLNVPQARSHSLNGLVQSELSTPGE